MVINCVVNRFNGDVAPSEVFKPGKCKRWTLDWTHGLDCGLTRLRMMTISNHALESSVVSVARRRDQS